MQPVIRIDQLTKEFKQLTAVNEVTLSINRAEIFGLIGPNGAGKSTLIKMLTTLLPPSSGDAWIGDFSIRTQPQDVRRCIGYIPQLLSADGSLTAYENLLLSARLYGIPWRQRATKIETALSTIGLADSADVLVRNYSGGMIRRLEIAQGMMHEPVVLFMDEPTVGLDPSARQMVWDHIDTLRKSSGTTMFITTHYMEEADEFCDRIAFIHQGQIQMVGTPDELKAKMGGETSLDDIFKKLTGTEIGSGGSYRDVRRTRRSVRQHG